MHSVQTKTADKPSAGAQAHPKADAPIIEVSNLVVRYGDVTAVHGVSFSVGPGEHVTLLGPSGCGKTTTLRAIAGLESPAGGSIVLQGQTVYSSAEGVNLGSERRGVSMVFQSYAIWPHMTVFENVAYGLRVRKLPEADIKAAVVRALEMVQMESFSARSASMLSGGQQQRVALARAIAFSPKIILFDEPLSNLDAKLRAQMRVTLRRLQKQLNFTSVYVTHDQEEALAISDRVIVMKDGRIEQAGAPAEIYSRPRSRFVADFVGSANLLSGRVKEVKDDHVVFETADGAILKAVAPHRPTGKEDVVALRTAHIEIGTAKVEGGNVLQGTITEKIFLGDFTEYLVACGSNRVVVRQPPTQDFQDGATVWLSFPPDRCVLLAE